MKPHRVPSVAMASRPPTSFPTMRRAGEAWRAARCMMGREVSGRLARGHRDSARVVYGSVSFSPLDSAAAVAVAGGLTASGTPASWFNAAMLVLDDNESGSCTGLVFR